MHKTARQRYVLDIISEQGQASITELAEKLQVSADTIRRDLTDLENQGLAQKNHGGAIALNLFRHESSGPQYHCCCLKPNSVLGSRSRRQFHRAPPCFWMPEAR